MRKNIPDVVYALQKVKDGLEFVLGAKKKQVTFDAYFQKKITGVSCDICLYTYSKTSINECSIK